MQVNMQAASPAPLPLAASDSRGASDGAAGTKKEAMYLSKHLMYLSEGNLF